MENIQIGKNIDQNFYLIDDNDFYRISDIMAHQPQFQVGEVKQYFFSDTYFETPEYFLKELDATIRIRKLPDKQILSIVCNELEVRREFQMDMEMNDEITSKDEYIFFLEDKLQDIYTHRIDVDVVRKLHQLKPFLTMETQRIAHTVKNNREFLCEVDFDQTIMKTKRNEDIIYVLEVKNKCFTSAENEMYFEKLVKEFKRKVTLIPMNEKKLDAGMRIFRREW